MKGSIIIPTFNSEKTIGSCLNSLVKQIGKNYEIICIDDGSTDNTKQIISKFKRVKLISTKHGGPARARNIGAKRAKGDILLFTDADCIADKNWVRRIENEFKKSNADIVSGSLINGSNNIYSKAIHLCWASSLNKKLPREEKNLATSANMSIKKRVFEKIGGFNQKMLMAEDSDLSIRASKKRYRIMYQPNIEIIHTPQRTTFISFLKHRFNHGIWEAINILKHKPFQSTSRYFSKNWMFMLLFLPFLALFATASVIKKNLKYNLEVFIYLPLILIGRIAWAIGVVRGTYLYNRGV